MNTCKYRVVKNIITVLCIFLMLMTNINAEVLKSIVAQKETPEQFDSFLKHCTLVERITLAQSLGYLPSIPQEAFGKLKYDEKKQKSTSTVTLEPYDSYTDSNKDNNESKKPIRPKTFNEIPPVLIISAINENFLEESLFSPEMIKKELLWAYSYWYTYLFKSKSKVNYSDIVEWIAEREEIERHLIEKLPTYELSELIVKKYFEKTFSQVWDEMSKEKRSDLLRKIEIDKGVKINNIAGIASGSAAAALATLSTTIGLTGFAFYTTMSSIICSTFAIIGVTLPFSAYLASSTAAATLGGPVGWGIAGVMIAATPFFFGWPTPDPVERFIFTKFLIESSHKNK